MNCQNNLYDTKGLRNELLNANRRREHAEVLLSNLLALKHESREEFIIPFDDLVVSIESAIYILQK